MEKLMQSSFSEVGPEAFLLALISQSFWLLLEFEKHGFSKVKI